MSPRLQPLGSRSIPGRVCIPVAKRSCPWLCSQVAATVPGHQRCRPGSRARSRAWSGFSGLSAALPCQVPSDTVSTGSKCLCLVWPVGLLGEPLLKYLPGSGETLTPNPVTLGAMLVLLLRTVRMVRKCLQLPFCFSCRGDSHVTL